tara:strand:+ start:247 stop:447 length:201 start_codon:yes stop_codon:yes gene_type:complete
MNKDLVKPNYKIGVIWPGCIDLSSAAAFSKKYPVTRFDANHNRIFQLSKRPNFNQKFDFYDFKGFF